MNQELSQEYLKSILDYNPETGVFTWKIDGSNQFVKIGNIAGTKHNYGYIQIKFNGKIYKAHRLAWLYVYGEFPSEQIDHINHDKADNRIVNLRAVSHQENIMNQPKRINNTSGYIGISWNRQAKKWRSKIRVNNKQIHLGYFININDAIAARKEAEIKYNFHENHGK